MFGAVLSQRRSSSNRRNLSWYIGSLQELLPCDLHFCYGPTMQPISQIPISHSKASTKTTRLTRTRSLYLSLRQKARYLSTAIAVVVMRETDAITKAITVVGDTSAQYKDGTSTMVDNIRPKCKGTTTKPAQRSDNAKLQKRALEGGCIDWLFRSATKMSVFPIEAAKNTRTSSTQIKEKIFFENSCKKE